MKNTLLFISMAALSPVAVAQDSAPDKEVAKESTTVMPGTLTTVIADSATFSTLTKELKAADLDVTLGGKDNFTVFAPTDEALGKLPGRDACHASAP